MGPDALLYSIGKRGEGRGLQGPGKNRSMPDAAEDGYRDTLLLQGQPQADLVECLLPSQVTGSDLKLLLYASDPELTLERIVAVLRKSNVRGPLLLHFCHFTPNETASDLHCNQE